MRPKRFAVASTSALHVARPGDVRDLQRGLAAPIISTVSSPRLREVFAFTITDAPPAASERAMARPMLRAPPVTSATLPASSLAGRHSTLLGNAIPSVD